MPVLGERIALSRAVSSRAGGAARLVAARLGWARLGSTRHGSTRLGWAARSWWDAVCSGQFLTRWSALVSLLVAALLSVPTIGEPSAANYAVSVVIATLGWMPLAAALALVAVLERRLTSRPARAVIVLGSIAVVAASRSFVNDVVSLALIGIPTIGAPGPRIVTNLLTAYAALSLVAVITSQVRNRRATVDRLTDALARMRIGVQRTRAFVATTDTMLGDIVSDLRARRDALLAGTVTFDTVRAYSERVRAASHRLERLSQSDLAAPRGDERIDGDAVGLPTPPLLARLVPTPWLSVALIYVIAALPFGVAAGGTTVGLIAVVAMCALDLAAGSVVRVLDRGPRRRARGIRFLIVWIAVGCAVMALATTLLPHIGVLGLLPVVTLPVLAVFVSLSVDAAQRARAEEVRATAVLTSIVRALASTTARAVSPLRRAAEVLHGDVQGRCVILAARADERAPTRDELNIFREGTDRAFADLTRAADAVDTGSVDTAGELERMLRAWESVIAVTTRISDDARAALAEPDVMHQATEAVNEALLNAVKHSAASKAAVEITSSAEAVFVRVSSAGRLPSGRVHGFGSRAGGTRIVQDGDQVVFEAHIAVSRPEPLND